jgi:DNA-binding FadR family transcriptional regulator
MQSDRKMHSLHGQVAERLGTQIISGDFQPGAAFPVESELCDALGVSRSTLREAIKNLAAKGLISVGPSVGTRVQAPNRWNLLDRDVLMWKIQLGIDEKLIHDIYEMRECFEPMASALVAVRASKADRAAIEAALERMVEVKGDPQASADADTAFHVRILASTGNDFLASLSSVVEVALRVSFINARIRKPLSDEDIESHRRIVEGIVACDGDAAFAATAALLAESKKVQLAALKPKAATRKPASR